MDPIVHVFRVMSTETAPVVNASRSVTEEKNASYRGNSSGLFPTQCSPMPLPALGFQRIIHGNGTDVGTVIALHCPDKHKLIGDSVKCVMDSNSTYWVGETYCTPFSYNEAYGFHLAVLLSTVSLAIIFLMSVAFLTCCLVNCMEKAKRKEMDRNSEMAPQWEEHQDRQQEVNRARNNNKSRNNNNNKCIENEMIQRNQREPGPCNNYHTCRCQQPYDPTGPCSYVAAARLPVLPGYEHSQQLNPQNPTSLYPYSQPLHVGSSRQTLNSDLVQAASGSDPVWEYGAKQSSLSGASNHTRNKTSAKECSIRVISV